MSKTPINTPPRFVHLRLHSEYSISDSIVRLDDVVARAAADGMPALALTDLANLFGLVKFYQSARKAGIKPVVGADVWITNKDDPGHPHRLLLLVRSHAGYLALCELLTRAHLAPKRGNHAEIEPHWLSESFSRNDNGLIALSGAHNGDVGEALLAGKTDLARQRAVYWSQIFPGAFYLEIQRVGRAHDETLVAASMELATELDLPLVATHPIQFLDRGDFKAHEARVCIAEGQVLSDTRRVSQFNEEHYFKSQAQMVAAFADLPEALENSVEIARRCNLALTLGKSFLPPFPTPDNISLDDYLVTMARAGLENRLLQLFASETERIDGRRKYDERLEFECQMIIKMGFSGYFLIVADFINWAKEKQIPVGPGRGSGAGSLVAFSLGITDIDPLRYALLFERFLNPERVSMPDFDVDFCQDRRGEVIEYVRGKYGPMAVAQIVTFGTMAARAVIRDVGRVLDLPYNFCDQISKLIPNELGISLKKAREIEPDIARRIEEEEEVRNLWTLAEKLEGLTRNVGMHAGGVLIAPGKLTDYCPLYSADGGQTVVSQFDKDDVEKIGLVKFDFLGLRNLTTIARTLDYIESLGDKKPDLLNLPFDDPPSYRILKEANTTAIFQVESEGMKKLLKKLSPDRFEDIIAVLALYRPGPLGSGMVDDFILRKKGEQRIDYFHPALTDCLAPTYGVIVYQEQVMQISQIIGGYTLGAADLLRRAMGKKKAEEMAEQRGTFRTGAQKNNVDGQLAIQLFDLMEKFAEYGFNKSHTAAYAVITYQTAWLKAHHCAAFMAATLSSDMDNTDAIHIFYEDAIKNKLKISGPDINESDYFFTPTDRQTIRYGLGAIKGVGRNAVEALREARNLDGPFKDLFDFCRRVDKRHVNRRAIEAMIRAGAFDALDDHRAFLMASLPLALEAAEQAAANAHQASLFDEPVAEQGAGLGLTRPPHWNDKQKLAEEKQALGFFFSAHPFDALRAESTRWIKCGLDQLEPCKDLQWLAGIVIEVRTQISRRGKMAIVKLDDGRGQQDITIYSELYEAGRPRIRVDEPLFIGGKISADEYRGGIRVVAEELLTLTEARSRFARELRIRINNDIEDVVRRLRDLIINYQGSCPVVIDYRNEKASCELRLGKKWSAQLDDGLLSQLREWLSAENVQIN